MTETSPVAAISRPPVELPKQEHWDLRATQGQPVCGVEARIVDDTGDALPNDGVAVGELQVRGPWITGGYFRQPADESFQNGWLATGDVGTINTQHYITLTDRAKDVIKSGGEWISSVELELVIASHPAVREAAVVAVPDERWQERPLAAVVVKQGHTVTPDELRDFLKDKVARWWIPERWTFIDQVPRTSVGKFDKKVLRASYADSELEVINLSVATSTGNAAQ